ncbi:glycerol-3-phosphate dehydrogenase [Chromatiales bacterium (ex Bugula neritina AB1)]|nr:glycerol-3-phosphate dehydrogenase [Chromatiales bacterium (ex Bugula neritina AB1)]
MNEGDYDLIIIGGGINGAGVARDAAGRGLKVLLCEKDDLAMHTSSASTKLIHGGLRYLEYYDFKLVRHALQEREVLLRSAPHIIWPLRFILPHHRDLRPRWLIRLGLFLYDHIGGRKLLPKSHSVDLKKHTSGAALRQEFSSGFEYSDCWVQDSRLVVLCARDAADKGAEIRVNTRCTDLTVARDNQERWNVELQDRATDKKETLTARAVVNAAGPWVEDVIGLQNQGESKHGVRLVKGSHVVVKKLFDHDYTYIFQNADNRILFAVPYEGKFTLLGTTDIEVSGDPETASVEQKEIDYICNAVSEYFKRPVKPENVVWSYTGVRPLYDDASANASKVTRDYVIHMSKSGPPLVSIFGGKITTHRKLSEEVMDMLAEPLNVQATAWTKMACLPGGDIANADFESFVQQTKAKYPWLSVDLLNDYTRNYGTRITGILAGASAMTDLGEHFGGGLYAAEVQYLADYEWARCADDILWRRSRKGLHVPPDCAEKIDRWMESKGIHRAA